MRLQKTDLLFVFAVAGSLTLTVVLRLGRDGAAIAWPAVMVILFVIPVLNAFEQGRAAGQRSQLETAAPWVRFRSEFLPRTCVWILTWIPSLVMFEVYLESVVGGLNLISTIPAAAYALTMVASGFVWARRHRSVGLGLRILFTPLVLAVVLLPLAVAVVHIFGWRGYMDLGLLFLPPLILAVFLVIGAVRIWLWTRRLGDDWFHA